MHYIWQPLFLSLFLSALFGNDNLASGGRIPRAGTDLARREDTVVALGSAEYVSPDLANNARRQASEATAVAVPKNQLEKLLIQIQEMELTILAIINQYSQDGTLDSEEPSGVFAGDNVISISSPSVTSLDPGPLASAVSSELSALPTAVNSENTATIQTGNSIPSNGINVAADSTTVASAVVTSLANVAAESTTTADSGGLTAGSLDAAVTSDERISIMTSSSPAAAPTVTRAVVSTAKYTFSAKSAKNIAVYFGQTAVTSGTTLAAQCADPNIDIVILAFVIAATDGGLYPQLNFGAACGGQTAEMKAKAPGLLSCTKLATDIVTCQSKYGKKVFLSIGGSSSQISFKTATSASTFATTLWNLFGPPGTIDSGLRPFGTAQVDGFDVDNEDNISTNWPIFASTLRTHFSKTYSKTYYLSSAPQCPFPDASNPLPLLLLCDFVWVQFYNNPSCQIGATGFAASVKQWSTALAKSTLPLKTRLYVGAPAFAAAGQTAYASFKNAQGIQAVEASVRKLNLANFGGAMFWDGPEGQLNTAAGKNIFAYAKAGLTA